MPRSPASRWLIQAPRKNRQAIFLDGDFLYLFGGNNSLEQHDFEPQNFVAEGWRLHLPSLQWQRVADFPAARQSMSTVQWEGHALAVGGFGHDGKEAVSQLDAYEFDFEHGRFAQRAGLPAGKSRTQFGLAQYGGKLWIFGGLNYDPRRKGDGELRSRHERARRGRRRSDAAVSRARCRAAERAPSVRGRRARQSLLPDRRHAR